MYKRVIIQARVNSTRLPAKAFLPIGGMSAVQLAARRAANSGLDVHVATSRDSDDDALARMMRVAGFPVWRGHLDDVLGRFADATEDLPEAAVVVRLTADNVFPDGPFIDELLAAFERDAGEYLATSSPSDGLPFGMSAEAFLVKALREAHKAAVSPSDREHVTPWIRRQYGASVFRPKGDLRDLSHLRCTVDSIDDYQRISKLFAKVPDPETVHWLELCRLLEEETPHPFLRRKEYGGAGAELVLGTAQLGLPSYGRTNTKGRPSDSVGIELVRNGVRHGLACIDTARAYGRAEAVMGTALRPFGDRVRVVTKLSPLSDLPEDASEREVRSAVEASVYCSCKELQLSRLPALLLHRWTHRTSHNGAVWRRLTELKSEGVIQKLGVSVSNPTEAKEAFADPEITHLQLPFNVLDGRWEAAEIDVLARKRLDVVVHARSVFLQGILLGDPEVWPIIEGFDARYTVQALETMSRKFNRVSRADLCLAFARSCDWIQGIVVGVEIWEQLNELIAHFQRPLLNNREMREIRECFLDVSESLLNPALWPRI